jgi:hypothetical protein
VPASDLAELSEAATTLDEFEPVEWIRMGYPVATTKRRIVAVQDRRVRASQRCVERRRPQESSPEQAEKPSATAYIIRCCCPTFANRGKQRCHVDARAAGSGRLPASMPSNGDQERRLQLAANLGDSASARTEVLSIRVTASALRRSQLAVAAEAVLPQVSTDRHDERIRRRRPDGGAALRLP